MRLISFARRCCGMPILLGALLFVGVLSASQALILVERQKHLQGEQALVSQEALTMVARLQSEINANVYLASGLVAFIGVSQDPEPEQLQAAMGALFDAGRGIRNIGLAPGNRIAYVYPAAGNEAVIGLYYPDIPEQWPAVARAIARKATSVAGPLPLKQGGQGLISRTPVFLADGGYWGILSLVLDADRMFASVLRGAESNHLNIAMRWLDEGGAPAATFLGEPALFARDAVIRDIALPGATWQIAAEPAEGWEDNPVHLQLLDALSLMLAAIVALATIGRLRHRRQIALGEKRLAAVTQGSRDAVVVVDASGVVIDLNPAAERLFAIDAQTARTRPAASLFRASDTPEATVVDGWRGDGARLTLEITYGALADHGERLRIYAIRDVGERVATETALRESEERFRSLASQVPGIIFQWREGPGDSRGFTYVSPRSKEILGHDADALLANWNLFAVHPDDEEAWAASIARSLATGDDWQFEGRLLRGGEVMWWRAYSRPSPLADGGTLFTGVIFDITRFKIAEEKLVAKERELAIVLESALDGILSFDANGIILSANPAAAEIFAYPVEELVGRHFSMLTKSRIGSEHERHLEAASGEARRIAGYTRIVVGLRRGGEAFPLELNLSQATIGAVRAFTGVVRDITERVAVERSLEAARASLEQKARDLEALADERDRARRDAEKATEAKSDFLAMMSHELRTPMTGILSIADLLLAKKLSAQHRTWISTLRRSGMTLLALLNDILDFSKIEAGKLSLEEVAFRPQSVMGRVRDLLAASAHDKGLYLEVEPPAEPTLTLLGDPTRVQQILLNLATNALKFTEAGGVRLRMTEARALGDGRRRLLFEVEDSGIGVAQELLDHLFEPFTQAEASTTRRFGGTGLGLAISRRLAEAMGGEIGVRRAEGRGSVFWFSILATETEPADVDEAPRLRAPLGQTDGPPLDILVAEDNETNRLLLIDALSMCGHKVVAVENGAEAVAAASGRRFDAVIIDMQMPVMDGLTAARIIRDSDQPAPPVILLTADALARRSFEQENVFAAVLTKPIDWSRLFAALGACTRPEVAAPPPEVSGNVGDGEGKEVEDPELSDVPTLSLNWLKSIGNSLPPERIEAIYRSLLQKLELLSGELRAQLENGEAEQAGGAIHSLYGLASQFGLERVAHTCDTLAKELPNADLARRLRLLGRLREEVSSASEAIRRHLETEQAF